MKKISVVSLLLVISMIFVGCTSEEFKLYQAFEKSTNITSMESKTDISFTVNVKEVSEEDKEFAEEFTNILNDFKINAYQKTVSNKEQLAARTENGIEFDLAGVKMDVLIWTDVNLSGDNPELTQIIKFPKMLMAGLPEADENKEYIVYDVSQILNDDWGQVNFYELGQLSGGIEDRLTNFVKENYLSFDPGFKIAEFKGEKSIDGELLSMYEVNLKDTDFKKLMRYSMNYSLDNGIIVDLAEDYMNLVVDVMETEEWEKELVKEQLNYELATLQEDIPAFKEKFNQFMDKLDKVKIIGDKGIVIEYGVNKNGYIVHEEGMIDLYIDLSSIENAFYDTDIMVETMLGTKAPIIELGINFKKNTYNINEDIKITMPEVNAENSISVIDFVE